MKQHRQSQSRLLAAAAAGIAACSLSSVEAQTQAEIDWTPGPSDWVGSYTAYLQRDPYMSIVVPDKRGGIDFNGDGLDDFQFYFYYGFKFRAYLSGIDFNRSEYNPAAEVMASYDPSNGNERQASYATLFQTPEEVYQAAVSYETLPQDGSVTQATGGFDTGNAKRYFIGVIFDGLDGNKYVGYADVLTHTSFLGPDVSTYVYSLAVYDVGYALYVPGPPASDVPGDTDGDVDVDNSDLQTAISNFTGPQTSSTPNTKTAAQGDMNGDGSIDNSDLQAMIAGFTGPLATPVPEPGSLALLALLGLGVLRRRRRQVNAIG